MNTISELIGEALRQPADAIFYSLSRALQKRFPDRDLLETDNPLFSIEAYANEGHCTIQPRSSVHSEYDTYYDPTRNIELQTVFNAWETVWWRGQELEVLSVGVREEHCRTIRRFVLGPSRQVTGEFFRKVCRWNGEIRGEVLVFSGHWYKDQDLYEAIQNSVLENLVLEGDLKEQLRSDFTSFFETKHIYERHGIPWKRGVLFLGPPGNGKTHAVKALLNLLKAPCLYVKSFRHPYQTDHQCMASVFQRARESAPCVLVLEDLDSLLTDENRSYFLNEMDGFASNAGIMTVATTNHPERLDPAILERPSRFDRKITFNLPNTECRLAYLQLFNERLESELRLTESELEELAAQTEGFSFAYLKELFLSAMMSWVAAPGSKRMAELMTGQTETLLAQMRTAPAEPPTEREDPMWAARRMMMQDDF